MKQQKNVKVLFGSGIANKKGKKNGLHQFSNIRNKIAQFLHYDKETKLRKWNLESEN